jgi:hypothetical protein
VEYQAFFQGRGACQFSCNIYVICWQEDGWGKKHGNLILLLKHVNLILLLKHVNLIFEKADQREEHKSLEFNSALF